MAELFHAKLARLRGTTSRSALSRLTAGPDAIRYVGEKTIQALEENPGRVPDAEIIEALAAALEISPTDFYEYPIALARRDAKAAPAEDLAQALDDAAPDREPQQRDRARKPAATRANGRAAVPKKPARRRAP